MIALLLACAAPDPDPPSEPTWVDTVATDPDGFIEHIGPDRAAWAALHRGELEGFSTELGRSRLRFENGRLTHHRMALHHDAAAVLRAEWPDSPAPLAEIPPPAPLPTRPGGWVGSLFGPLDATRSGAGTEAARGDLRALRLRLERHAASRSGTADGEAAVRELDADGVARVQTAITLAETALAEGDAAYARTALELGSPPDRRTPGPTCPPVLFWLGARATLASGDARGALDWLAPLGDASEPERSVVQDLAVWRGMSRTGDSKE